MSIATPDDANAGDAARDALTPNPRAWTDEGLARYRAALITAGLSEAQVAEQLKPRKAYRPNYSFGRRQAGS